MHHIVLVDLSSHAAGASLAKELTSLVHGRRKEQRLSATMAGGSVVEGIEGQRLRLSKARSYLKIQLHVVNNTNCFIACGGRFAALQHAMPSSLTSQLPMEMGQQHACAGRMARCDSERCCHDLFCAGPDK